MSVRPSARAKAWNRRTATRARARVRGASPESWRWSAKSSTWARVTPPRRSIPASASQVPYLPRSRA
ncbi:Uncharacterised protein [Mycobacteroides abscessus subsp. abscessus]|nr:Uncharacterised protein [Mycobacteroides abscessus subsp. abscessus]